MAATPKTGARRSARGGAPRARAKKGSATALARRPASPAKEVVLPAAPSPPVSAADGGLPQSVPERAFAGRVTPPEPERPLPAARRAIFFDVENSSRADHIARVIDHLGVDRVGRRTDFVAVGNWRVIGHDTARLLARHGAQLVHTAPSVGVRDWSDLRIAVAAGVWLAAARPGDIVEIISDDRAFDAVGDVAAGLGIAFHRLSYRTLTGTRGEPAAAREPAREAVREAVGDSGSRRRRRGRRRGRRGPAPSHGAPMMAAPPPRDAGNGAEAPALPHTAPHDELVGVVRDLIRMSPARGVTLDALANALKARGFSRPPGSPRLITRLRRIKDIEVSRSGIITLLESASRGQGARAADDRDRATEERQIGPTAAEPADSGPMGEGPPASGEPPPRRRRTRRGGRRRRPRAAGPTPVV